MHSVTPANGTLSLDMSGNPVHMVVVVPTGVGITSPERVLIEFSKISVYYFDLLFVIEIVLAFTYGLKFKLPLIIGVGVGILVMCAGGAYCFVRRRRMATK